MDDKKLQELYSLIVSKDASYANDVSLEQFKVKMQDEAYNTKMQNWLGASAPPQNAGVDIDAFLGKKPVKKKEPSVSLQRLQEVEPTLESSSEDASLASSSQTKNASLIPELIPKPSVKEQLPIISEEQISNEERDWTRKYKQENEQIARIEKVDSEKTKVDKKKFEQEFEQGAGNTFDKNNNKYLNDRLKTITPDLITKNEEFVVPKLNYQFGDLGFTFEETGVGDYMIVTAPDKKTTTKISLDPSEEARLVNQKAISESKKLQQFIKDNSTEKGLYVIEKSANELNKKFDSQKDIDASIKKIADEANGLNVSLKSFLDKKSSFDKMPSGTENYNKIQAELIAERDELLKKQDNIKTKEVLLNKSVGKYTEMKAQQGSYFEGTWNALLDSFASASAGIADIGIDIMSELMPNEMQMSPSQLKEESFEISKKLGIAPPTEKQTFVQWKATLTEDQQDDVEDKLDDITKKSAKKDLIPLVRQGNRELFGSSNATPEWEQLKSENFWGGAYFGLVKTVPALIGGAGVTGWVQRTANMYAMVSDGIRKEMDANPDFDNVSENEKLGVVLPIGITSAVFEEFGLMNIKGSTGVINRIAMSALGKSGMRTTAKTFRELVENEVESALAKGLLTIGSAGLAEFESGAAQEFTETGIKAIYNQVQGKKMFETPETIGQWVNNIVIAGAQEAVGGFVLGMPTAVSAAYSQKGFLKMDDQTFKMFESAANDENIQKAFITKLKTQITQGVITTAEAKEQLNNYRNSVGLFRSLTEGLNTQQKKEAMNLLKEKRDLENQVDGKDSSLSAKLKERIAAIDASLVEISEVANNEKVIAETNKKEFDALPDAEKTKLKESIADNVRQTYGDEVFLNLDDDKITELALRQFVSQKNKGKRIAEIEAMLSPDAETQVSDRQKNKLKKELDTLVAKPNTEGLMPIEEIFENADSESLKNKESTAKALESLAADKTEGSTFTDNEGNALPVVGNENTLSELYHEAVDTPMEQRTEAQNSAMDVVKKSLNEKVKLEKIFVEDTAPTQDDSRSASNKSDMGDMKGRVKGQAKVKVIESAQRAIKTLKSILPNFDIHIHEDEGSYNAAMQKVKGESGSKGNFYSKGDGTGRIDINLSRASATTVAHEVAHGVMLKVFGDNPALFKKFRENISKVLKDDKNKVLNEFADRYGDDVQHEEYLVQLTAILEQEQDSISTTTVQKIAAIINKVLSTISGGKIVAFQDITDTKELIDFLNNVSGSIREGGDINIKESSKGLQNETSKSQKGDNKNKKEAPKFVRDISALITPATVRGFNPLTKRIKKLSLKYDDLVKQYAKNKDPKILAKIKTAETQILNDAKQEIVDAIAKIDGVSVQFKDNKRGLWENKFEPSFNMNLSISPQADTKKISDLLFDFATKYSQDAFILETESEFEEDVFSGKREIPLTEFDKNDLMHYPQIIYTFDTPITDEQVADLSVALEKEGVSAFSINNNAVQVSVIKFLSPEEEANLTKDKQYEERKRDLDSKSIATEKATADVLGPNVTYNPTVRIKKSSYQGAINEKSADQTRQFDRSDVLKAFKESTTKIEKLAVELANLRQKEINLKKEGKELSVKGKAKFDKLVKQIQPVIQRTFETNKKLYEDSKIEVEGIAQDAIEQVDASISPFPIKRAERASVKTIRWYNSFTERLGDGARVNIVTDTDVDADKVFEIIDKKYPVDKELRRISETTDLGYPKRLIEIRTSNGVIAEIQVITNEAYLAKDGVKGFTGDKKQKATAKQKLDGVRSRLGWSIPDGLGHYFYEIQRDTNVDENLRDEAARLSDIYYDAFTNPKSKLKESFMKDVMSFKEQVDGADKSKWDVGNIGKAPESITEGTSKSQKGDMVVANVEGLIKKNKIEGNLFNEQEAKDYQELIESKYNDSGIMKFGQESDDIRQNLFNYDNPLAEKDVNGVNVKIAEGLIEGEPYSGNRKKTYLLYADGKIAGKFYSVSDAKKVVNFIEANLVKSLPTQEIEGTSKSQKGDEYTIDGKQATKKEVIEEIQSVSYLYPYGDSGYKQGLKYITYNGTKQNIIDEVDDHNKKSNPYNKSGELKKTYMGGVILKAFQNTPFRSFMDAYRKTIDKYASKKIFELGGNSFSNITFQEKMSYIIGDVSYEVTEEQFRQFSKKLKITIPPLEEGSSKSQLTEKNISEMVKKARAEGLSDEAIRKRLLSNGISSSDIDIAMESTETSSSKIEVNEQRMAGYDAMLSKVRGIREKSAARGRSENDTNNSVMAYVMGSDVYKNASDIQREAIVRQIRKDLGLREKSAPKVTNLLDGDMVTVSSKVLVLEKIKALVRGGKDAVKAIKVAQEQLKKEIKERRKSGKITAAQLERVIGRLGKTDLLSPTATARFIDYMGKVFADAEYGQKISDAYKTRSQILSLTKNKDKNVDLKTLGVEFAKIDPSMVEDIDAYNDMAKSIEEAIRGSTIKKGNPKFAASVKIDSAMEYVKATLETQERLITEERIAEIQELMGIDATGFSAREMIDLLKSPEPLTKYNEPNIRALVSRAFDAYKSIIEQELESGIDAFTGEPVYYTAAERKAIREFMEMDTDKMPTAKEGLDAVDSLINFLANKSTAKMMSVTAKYNGQQNAKKVVAKKIESVKLKKLFMPGLARTLAEQTTNLNIVFEKMFKGFNRSRIVMEAMGLLDFINRKAYAQNKSKIIVSDYINTFYKKGVRPNGQAFNTAYNEAERGMAAFMMRNVIDSPEERAIEFDRRKRLIKQSIDALRTGNEKEQKKSKIYEEAYNKVLADAEGINDIIANTDKINLDAIDYWHKQWNANFEQMASTSIGIYNKILERDSNFSPDRFSKLSEFAVEQIKLDEETSAFHTNNGTLYKRAAGSLQEATRPTNLGEFNEDGDMSKVKHYIDLSFDRNNSNSMYDALVDIETAASIRQVQAFMNSDDFRKIVPYSEDRALLKNRINLYIRKSRGKESYSDDELSKFMRVLNKVSTIGVGQALGGITQPAKQVIPIAFNTIINGGGLNVVSVFDKDFTTWLESIGMPISNRGIQSQTEVDNINAKIQEAADSKGEQLLNLIESANKQWLKIFLVAPDVFIARASWKGYYEKALAKQGIDIKGLDYSTHEVNMEAANYAQGMVDRQQNISDHDMSGKAFVSTDVAPQIIVKSLMAFASFRMNAASRTAADLSTIGHWSVSTKEDKAIALKSLAGYAVEQAVFKSITVGISLAIGSLALSAMGKDEDDDEFEKRKNNLIKGAATGAVTDIFSPVPVTDKLIQDISVWTLDQTQSLVGVSDEDKLSLFGTIKESFLKGAGTFGIAIEKASQLIDLVDLSYSGTYIDDYGKEKKITEEDREALSMFILPAIMTNIGLAPSEVSSLVRNAVKSSKKAYKTDAERAESEQKDREEAKENREKINALVELRSKTSSSAEIEFINKKIRELNLEGEEKKEFKKAKEEENKIKNAKKELLLDDFENQSDMKKYAPEKWERNFGEGSEWYRENSAEMKVNKNLRKEEKEEKEDLYNYVEPSKSKKKSTGWGTVTKKKSTGWGSSNKKKNKGWGSK